MDSEDSWEKTATDLSDVDTPVVSVRRSDSAGSGESDEATGAGDVNVELMSAADDDNAVHLSDAAQAMLDTASTIYNDVTADNCISLDPLKQVCWCVFWRFGCLLSHHNSYMYSDCG